MKTLLTAFLLSLCGLAGANPLKSITELDLNDYRGQVVYMDFWASWCVPCRQSFPWLQSMQNKFVDDGFQVITINLDEQREDAERFLKDVGTVLPVFLDPDGAWAEKYELPGMPTSFLFDRNGELLGSHKGFRASDKPELERNIQTALKLPENG